MNVTINLFSIVKFLLVGCIANFLFTIILIMVLKNCRKYIFLKPYILIIQFLMSWVGLFINITDSVLMDMVCRFAVRKRIKYLFFVAFSISKRNIYYNWEEWYLQDLVEYKRGYFFPNWFVKYNAKREDTCHMSSYRYLVVKRYKRIHGKE